MALTRTRVPAATGRDDTASQYSPWTKTLPSGARSVIAAPISPTNEQRIGPTLGVQGLGKELPFPEHVLRLTGFLVARVQAHCAPDRLRGLVRLSAVLQQAPNGQVFCKLLESAIIVRDTPCAQNSYLHCSAFILPDPL